jgi:hypothetical protein
MNFDNNGMDYSINTSDPDFFLVLVNGGRGKYPSFGVNKNGVFFNNLVVDSNGKGLYRRPSKNVTHTTKLITDIVKGNIEAENLGEYLENIEVVNVPDWSTHNMICDSKANVWVVEPGRGNLYSPASSSGFYVMTNFSLWDYEKELIPWECKRYKKVSAALSDFHVLDIDSAFKILESAKQNNKEWKTDFSMVYSEKEHSVYYCFNGNFNERYKYEFQL